MDRLLIVNADDFGLSHGINYGIIDAHRRGIVTSTTAMMTAGAVEHAAQLSAETPSLGVGLHFVLTYGKPLSVMPSLQREGALGKWVWEVAKSGTLSLSEVENELEQQFQRFVSLFGRYPTHIDSHHHVHFIPQVWSIVSQFARDKRLPLRVDRPVARQNGIEPVHIHSTEGFIGDFYADNVSQNFFLNTLERSRRLGEMSVEMMCHPGFIDQIVQHSAYCFPRLAELEVLTSTSLPREIRARGYRLGSFRDLVM